MLNMFRSAIQLRRTLNPVGIKVEAEFSGYHHLLTQWSEGFADKLFVGERAVHFSGVKKDHATFNG